MRRWIRAPSADNQIYVLLDGRVVTGQPTDSLQFTLNVERGEHTVAVVLRDATGKVACQSAGVTFFVRQTSVLSSRQPEQSRQPARDPAPATPLAGLHRRPRHGR